MNIPDNTEIIPHYVALLAFQIAVKAQQESGNSKTPLTENLRHGLEILERNAAALIVKVP